MATLLHSESRRLYSWWWDSHNSPKNSKWLQENLTDMDAKVKAMIKLIEEDADSFARRAEMYYKKRPELMKLVEEFYRAYRSLAERYDHATGELRIAHRTMSEAFPNLALPEDTSLINGTEPPGTPEVPHPLRTLLDVDDLDKDTMGISSSGERITKKGLKQLQEMCAAESEVQKLKKEVDVMQAEKEALSLQYQQSVEKLSSMEEQLKDMQKGFCEINVQASNAQKEVCSLKETLVQLEAERDAGSVKYEESLARLSKLENEDRFLNNEISRLESEKNSNLETISIMEKAILVAEKNASVMTERANNSEREVDKLKEIIVKLTGEREDDALSYGVCLERISKLENELREAQEDTKRLNRELLKGAVQLKSIEEKSAVLETSNRFLRLDADSLIKKIAVKDHELCTKHDELEKLEGCVNDERLRYVQVEATLQTLQKLHAESKEDLKNGLVSLKKLGLLKRDLEEENRRFKDENQSLKEASSSSMMEMESEIVCLRKTKERLEDEVERQSGLSKSLQLEILRLKEEIDSLNKRYMDLIEQVELVGLSPVSLESSVKDLQNDNLLLRKEKEMLSNKLDSIEEVMKNNEAELTGLRGDFKFVLDEKSTLVGEKATLLSQLQLISENMRNLLERNMFLEDSLSHANVELESLREKSKCLDELCRVLTNEKSNIVTERSGLLVELENVEQRLKTLEIKFSEFEGKYIGLQKSKESTESKLTELRVCMGVEKEARESLSMMNEKRFSSLEDRLVCLQDDSKYGKKEFQEELDKAVIAQFEVFILQKFIQDMEEKNYALLFEHHKHVEESKLTDQLISELESENLEQQVEAELLLVEIEKHRLGIYKVFRALEGGLESDSEENFENGQISVQQIVGQIENMKLALSSYRDKVDNIHVEQKNFQRSYVELEQEYCRVLDEKRALREEKCTVEEENDSLVLETLAFDSLWTILKSFQAEHADELQNLKGYYDEVEAEIFRLRGKLEMNETENSLLKSSVQRLEIELCGVRDRNNELKQREKELLEAEEMNSDFCRIIEEMKGEYEVSKTASENEIQILRKEIEERRIREDNLSSELQEISNEFELWEAEAASFHFDLQTSTVREVLLQDKIHELSEVCEGLKFESALKTKEIDEIKEKLCYKESEIKGLNAQLNAYAPVIISLKDNVTSLEYNTLSLTKLIGDNVKPKEPAVQADKETTQELKEDQNPTSPNGISVLESLQTSIKSVENLVNTEIKKRENAKPKGEKTEIIQMTRSKSKCRSPVQEKGKQKEEIGLWYELDSYPLNLQKPKNEGTKNRAALMKDIPLDQVYNSGPGDQMLELWETVSSVDRSLVPSSTTQETNGSKMLQRLASDVEKLTTLQMTVNELKMKLETISKKGKKGNKWVDLETVKEQLQEVQESVIQLFELDNYLMKNVEVEQVSDQARKGSEKIGRLQLEVQKIEYLLMRSDSDKKKGKGRLARTKSIIKRKKKACFSGCFKASSSSSSRINGEGNQV